VVAGNVASVSMSLLSIVLVAISCCYIATLSSLGQKAT